jgi:hypothetical protein
LAAVALAVVVVGCASNAPAARPARDLSKAERIVAGYDEARATRSARMDGEITVRTGDREVAVPLEGAIDFANDAARFSVSLAGLGLPSLGDARIEARAVDGRLYLRLPGFAARFLGGATWAEVPIGAMGPTATDPTGFLDALRGVSEVDRVGTDTIRGVEATHYRGRISLADAIARAPEARREGLQRAFGDDATLPVDVWVDDRDRPVRFVATFAPGGTEVAVRLDLFDYGADVTVSAPPADEVTSLGGLLGGAGAGTSAPTANA